MKNYTSPELTVIDTNNMEGVFACNYYGQGRNSNPYGDIRNWQQQQCTPKTDNQKPSDGTNCFGWGYEEGSDNGGCGWWSWPF